MRLRGAGRGRGLGLEGNVGDWVVKLFESYRRVPANLPIDGGERRADGVHKRGEARKRAM